MVILEDIDSYEYFIKDKMIKNFTIFSVIIFFIFGSIYINKGQVLLGYIELSVGLALIVNLYKYKKYDNQKIASFIILASIYIMSLVIYVTGGVSNTGNLWILFIPIFTFILIDEKDARVWLIGYILALFIIEILRYIDILDSTYQIVEVKQTFLVFFLFIYIVYFNEMLKGGVKNILTKKNNELQKISTMDYLTEVYNRSYIYEYTKIEMHRSERNKKPMSIIFFDIDNFKYINDTYGHAKGDELLQNSCNLFSHTIRKVDKIGRWGGEEFIIVCPETDLESAKNISEKLRIALTKYQFSFNETVTASFGVVEYNLDDTIEEFIEKADSCMYKAKNSGKNKVVAYEG